jgi:hypothetical protein
MGKLPPFGLRTPEVIAAYLEACLAEADGDAAVITVALGDIFDQPAGVNSNSAWISSTLDFLGVTPGFRSADNFTLLADGQVTDVHWWGESQSAGDNFTFTFYADNSGAPGAVLW